MAIESLKAANIMAFQGLQQHYDGNDIDNGQQTERNDVFQLNFSDSINIIIGQNGVGKTTLLKMLYAAAQWSFRENELVTFAEFFSNHLSDKALLRCRESQQAISYFAVSNGKNTLKYNLKGFVEGFVDWTGGNIHSVFIPTTEMLSHAKGFLALNQKYKLPFDKTQVDIIVNASLPEARELPAYLDKVLKKISQVVAGEVIMENDNFYVQKSNGKKLEFTLEAEGLRKLGLLWKLIRNGLIDKGSILLWDEPEANLNPELFPVVADILLELEKAGVQIFIATHSYNLAKYFETRRTLKEQVMFHNICKYSALPDRGFAEADIRDGVFADSAYFMSELQGNKIIEADEKLLDEAWGKNLTD